MVVHWMMENRRRGCGLVGGAMLVAFVAVVPAIIFAEDRDSCPTEAEQAVEALPFYDRFYVPSHVTSPMFSNGPKVSCPADITCAAFSSNPSSDIKVPRDVTTPHDGCGVKLAATTYSAYAVRFTNGSVRSWGRVGGSSNFDVPDGVYNPAAGRKVIAIAATHAAFAALHEDGSVTVWGHDEFGNARLPEAVKSPKRGEEVVSIASNHHAFVAVLASRRVIMWGYRHPNLGDLVRDVPPELQPGGAGPDVTRVFSTGNAFAALLEDGSVRAWGMKRMGGNAPRSVTSPMRNNAVIAIASTMFAFAAIHKDGSVSSWGSATCTDPGDEGRDCTPIGDILDEAPVKKIFSTERAFAALHWDGHASVWGDPGHGGNQADVPSSVSSPEAGREVVDIVGNYYSFAALHKTGSVSAWAKSEYGGGVENTVLDRWGNDKKVVVGITPSAQGFAVRLVGGSLVRLGDSADERKPRRGAEEERWQLPDAVRNPRSGREVRLIAATAEAYAAVLEDGAVIMWGKGPLEVPKEIQDCRVRAIAGANELGFIFFVDAKCVAPRNAVIQYVIDTPLIVAAALIGVAALFSCTWKRRDEDIFRRKLGEDARDKHAEIIRILNDLRSRLEKSVSEVVVDILKSHLDEVLEELRNHRGELDESFKEEVREKLDMLLSDARKMDESMDDLSKVLQDIAEGLETLRNGKADATFRDEVLNELQDLMTLWHERQEGQEPAIECLEEVSTPQKHDEGNAKDLELLKERQGHEREAREWMENLQRALDDKRQALTRSSQDGEALTSDQEHEASDSWAPLIESFQKFREAVARIQNKREQSEGALNRMVRQMVGHENLVPRVAIFVPLGLQKEFMKIFGVCERGYFSNKWRSRWNLLRSKRKLYLYFVCPITCRVVETNGGRGYKLYVPKTLPKWVEDFKRVAKVAMMITCLTISALATAGVSLPFTLPPAVMTLIGTVDSLSSWYKDSTGAIEELLEPIEEILSEKPPPAGTAVLGVEESRAQGFQLTEEHVAKLVATDEALAALQEILNSVVSTEGLETGLYALQLLKTGLKRRTADDGTTLWVSPTVADRFENDGADAIPSTVRAALRL